MDKLFSMAISDAFGSRVECLLYYGSNAFETGIKSKLSDYDFCLVLDTRKSRDLQTISKITESFNGIDLTIHYVDELEQMGWNKFQHGSHGTFFLLHLASAKVLLGSNLFARKISVLDDANIGDSLRRQIIEYFWRLDHWYVEGKDRGYLVSRFKKYVVRIAEDILVFKGDISFAEINVLSHEDFVDNYIYTKDYFSPKTKSCFKKVYFGDAPTADDLLQLKESLYADFRAIFIS